VYLKRNLLICGFRTFYDVPFLVGTLTLTLNTDPVTLSTDLVTSTNDLVILTTDLGLGNWPCGRERWPCDLNKWSPDLDYWHLTLITDAVTLTSWSWSSSMYCTWWPWMPEEIFPLTFRWLSFNTLFPNSFCYLFTHFCLLEAPSPISVTTTTDTLRQLPVCDSILLYLSVFIRSDTA